MKYALAILILLQPAIALAVPDEVYVDPAINAASGTGTIGDPYGDVQFALDSVNHGGDGARFNVKAGTAEVLAAGGLSLDTHFATNGAPGATEPIIIEGYTSVAGDGGIAEFTGTANSAPFWVDTTTGGADVDYATFKNLKITTAQASGYSVNIDDNILFLNVELISNHGGIDVDKGIVDHCKISYVDSGGINGAFGAVGVVNSYIVQTSGAIITSAASCSPVLGNIFNVRAATDAGAAVINPSANAHAVIANNSILGNFSAGSGSTNAIRAFVPSAYIANNYIEGFNGTNDEAIDVSSASVSTVLANNAFFGNATNITDAGLNTITIGSTSSLAASGVTSASGADFTPTADLKGTGYPTGFLQLSGNATDPNIGAIETTGGGGNVVDPLSGITPGL